MIILRIAKFEGHLATVLALQECQQGTNQFGYSKEYFGTPSLAWILSECQLLIFERSLEPALGMSLLVILLEV